MITFFARRYCPKLKFSYYPKLSPSSPLNPPLLFGSCFLHPSSTSPLYLGAVCKHDFFKTIYIVQDQYFTSNKDIYVINFALGRCWPEKSRFLWDPNLASPGTLNLLWKELAVTFTTGE